MIIFQIQKFLLSVPDMLWMSTVRRLKGEIMEEAVRCSVCSEVYQEGPREPLVLPCGHAFCRRCLTNVHNTGHFTCPSCRRDLSHLDVQDLPQCFPLLSLSATYSEFQVNFALSSTATNLVTVHTLSGITCFSASVGMHHSCNILGYTPLKT